MKHILQCFSFVCILIILSNLLIETFINPILVYKVEQSTKVLTINNSNIDISKYIYNINNITLTDNKPLLHVTNILDLNTQNSKILSVINENNVLLFVIKKNAQTPSTLDQIVRLNISIYTESRQGNMIALQAIINSLTLKYTNIKVMNGFPQKQFESGSVVMLFDTIDNIARIMKEYNNYEILEYDQMNIHMLKTMIPSAFTQTLDMSMYISSYKSRFPIRKALCTDNVIATTNESALNQNFQIEASTLISNIGLVEKNNFLAMIYPYCKLTLDYMRKYNKYIERREDLPILEQFSQTYIPKRNVDGFFDSRTNSFLIPSGSIDGVPTVSMTYIHLKNQNRNEENGLYEVKSHHVLLKLGGKQKPDDETDERFRCFDNPMIKNKGLCESKLDENGNIRNKQLYWDRPCENNDECPFYQANNKYMNYRGGCNDGYCEFPIGVQRLSYRKYDPKSKPICHGCPLNNIYCCDEQVNKDYAFELDHIERLKILNE